MTAEEALRTLEPLIGSELGVGEWTLVSPERIKGFEQAVGRTHDEVPVLFILSLLPGAIATVKSPVESPRASVNYGLDRCRLLIPVHPGDRIRPRVSLLGVEAGANWLQLRRGVVLENEAGDALFDAETLTRWLW